MKLKRVITLKMSGDDVRQLQIKLKEFGFLKEKVDGHFGQNTLVAVTTFQRKIGIKAKSKESFSYGNGVYDILLENLVNQDDEENISGYQLSYVTKEKAQEEGWDEESEGGFYWGFSLSTEDGELLIEPTLNIKSFINYFVKVLYGNLKSKIILKQRELSQLQDIESYLNSL